MRRSAMPLALENAPDRARARGRRVAVLMMLALLVRVLGRAARLLRGRALRRRRQVHSGAPSLRQPDGDRLLGGGGAVLAFAHVVHLLAHELAGLRARRLAGAAVL